MTAPSVPLAPLATSALAPLQLWLDTVLHADATLAALLDPTATGREKIHFGEAPPAAWAPYVVFYGSTQGGLATFDTPGNDGTITVRVASPDVNGLEGRRILDALVATLTGPTARATPIAGHAMISVELEVLRDYRDPDPNLVLSHHVGRLRTRTMWTPAP